MDREDIAAGKEKSDRNGSRRHEGLDGEADKRSPQPYGSGELPGLDQAHCEIDRVGEGW